MIMLTTTLLRANFSIIFSHHSALTGKKKETRTHKKQILTRGSWGPSPPIPPSLTSEAWHPTFAKEQLQVQNKVGLVLVPPL
jgi:hypothetical protein